MLSLRGEVEGDASVLQSTEAPAIGSRGRRPHRGVLGAHVWPGGIPVAGTATADPEGHICSDIPISDFRGGTELGNKKSGQIHKITGKIWPLIGKHPLLNTFSQKLLRNRRELVGTPKSKKKPPPFCPRGEVGLTTFLPAKRGWITDGPSLKRADTSLGPSRQAHTTTFHTASNA